MRIGAIALLTLATSACLAVEEPRIARVEHRGSVRAYDATLTLAYDDDGRLVHLVRDDRRDEDTRFDLTWDDDGLLTQIARGYDTIDFAHADGRVTSWSDGWVRTTLAYDDDGRVTASLTESLEDAHEVERVQYLYEGAALAGISSRASRDEGTSASLRIERDDDAIRADARVRLVEATEHIDIELALERGRVLSRHETVFEDDVLTHREDVTYRYGWDGLLESIAGTYGTDALEREVTTTIEYESGEARGLDVVPPDVMGRLLVELGAPGLVDAHGVPALAPAWDAWPGRAAMRAAW